MLMTALLAAAAVGGMAIPPKQPAQPVIAVTVDDLPMHGPYPADESPVSAVRGVATALKAEGVEAYAFINGQWTESQPATSEALEIWRDAGLPLGNHGWAHRHLSGMSAAEFEQELVKNEPLLRRLSDGRDWKWFRYPFLDEGENADKRAAAREVLARHGYRVAAVTMDFTDWAWTAPYARCRDSGDEAAVARLEQLFLQSSRENIAYYRQLSRTVYGREIPYVLILHVSAFEARVLPRLLRLLREEGFRFTTLAEAQPDPAYADQNEPRLPAEPQGLVGKASAKVSLPPKTDYQAILAGMCASVR
jgi:peptidoglycan-N-acetylglucosamine deacetylase